MGEHSKYSASGFEANRLCAGRAFMERDLPDRTSIHGATGTAKHTVLELILNNRPVLDHKFLIDGFNVLLTDDDIQPLYQVAEDIRGFSDGGTVFSERRVNYARSLAVPAEEAWGTADAITFRGSVLSVHDYKSGYTPVQPDCDQLRLYGLGALEMFDLTDGPFETVELVIHQPEVSQRPQVFTIATDLLRTWGETDGREAVAARKAAEKDVFSGKDGWRDLYLTPGEKQCRHCRAKTSCEALRQDVIHTTFAMVPASPEEFAPVKTSKEHVQAASSDWLGAVLSKADMIEDFVKDVRAEAFRRLQEGLTVPGFKLVTGKRGNRAWHDPAAAEKVIREQFRLPVEKAYDMKLISPTTAEKLYKEGVIGARQWTRLQELFGQADGKPSVAPASDKRPAIVIQPVAESFPKLDDYT